MQIHFLTLFGVRFDFDLMPFFISHYKKLNLSSYTVYLHLSGDEAKDRASVDAFESAGFAVITIEAEKIFGGSKMSVWPGGFFKEPLFGAYIFSEYREGDFILIADSDEFQDWPRNPFEYAEKYEVVKGVLYDRYARSGLPPVTPALPLEEQYPFGHPALSSLWRAQPFETAKICLFKFGVPVALSGCHYVTKPDGTREREDSRPTAPDVLRVNHYRWRENILERVKDRYYYEDSDYKAIQKFFGLTPFTILIVTPKAKLGDFVLKLPTLSALRERFPNSKITGIVSKDNFELAKWFGLMDDFQSEDDFLSERKPLHGLDLVILFIKAAPMARIFSKYGAKRVIQPFQLSEMDMEKQFTFNFYKYLDVAFVPRPLRDDVALLIPYNETENESQILIHPGAGDKFKQFPAGLFIQLYRALQVSGKNPVMVCGPEEKYLSNFFKENFCAIFEPKSIVDFAKKVAASSCYIGHDSGGSHLAASMGIKTFVLHRQPTEILWQAIGENVENVFTNESKFLTIVLDLILSGDRDEDGKFARESSSPCANPLRVGGIGYGPQREKSLEGEVR